MKLIDDLYYYPWTAATENNCNTYLLDGAVRTLIDPGHLHLFTNVIDRAAKDNISMESVDLVIGTHSHPDHFEASVRFHDQPTRIALHEEAERYLHEIGPAFYQSFGQTMPRFRVDFHLREGELRLGDKTLRILHTPGHDPGSICIYWPDKKVLITGDVVFRGGVGRTDFPQCSGAELKQSIMRLMELDVEYLLPGHGELIEGAYEVKRNFALLQQMFFSML